MLELQFLDVGQGDSTYIRFPNGTTMLIDCNIRDDGFFGWFDDMLAIDPDASDEKRVLDYLVITHPHEDHIRGIGKLKDRYTIRNIWESGHRLYVPKEKQDKYTHYYDLLNLIQKVKKNNGEHIQLKAYNTITIEEEPDVNFTVLSPTFAYLEEAQPTKRDIHDQCAVLKLEYAGRSVMFTGDSSMEAWQDRIVPYYSDENGRDNLLDSTILHASHHCSYTFFKPKGKKDDEPYTTGLEKIKPEITIISVGKDNNHDHPHEDAYKLYCEHTANGQAQVYMTKDFGTISVKIHPTGDYFVYCKQMDKMAKKFTIGKLSIQTTPELPLDGFYDKKVNLNFKAKFQNKPKGTTSITYHWIIQNNGIGEDSSHHELFEGQYDTSSTYNNMTAYTGTHDLLCIARNQRNNIIATERIQISIK